MAYDEASPLVRSKDWRRPFLAACAGLACSAALVVRGARRPSVLALDARSGRSIDKVFYINCDADLDRRASIEAQLDRALPGVPRERVACTDTASAKFAYESGGVRGLDLSTETAHFGADEAYTTLAIYLSHTSIQETIAAMDDGLYLALEDDAVFADGFLEKFRALDLPEAFDLLWTPRGAATFLERLAVYDGGAVSSIDGLERTDDVAAFASYCLACASTIVATDEALPQDHSDGSGADARTCVSAR
ncbi:hypothetical protein JL720_4645 [Aureococcus anophagefferens]|nr:hypothetical protein JL720_4645 [Aureococcus anophagefferens]